MDKTLSLNRKKIPTKKIIGYTIEHIAESQPITNLRKLPSFFIFSICPSKNHSFPIFNDAYSWALNCKIIFENPKSANVLSAATLPNKYQ